LTFLPSKTFQNNVIYATAYQYPTQQQSPYSSSSPSAAGVYYSAAAASGGSSPQSAAAPPTTAATYYHYSYPQASMPASVPMFPADYTQNAQLFAFYLPVNTEHLENRRELVGRVRGKREASSASEQPRRGVCLFSSGLWTLKKCFYVNKKYTTINNKTTLKQALC
jgi:hypothetical protein